MTTKLFVAHAEASEDSALAEELKCQLVSAFSLERSDIFVSSDHESIKSYQEFPEAIRTAIREAQAVVILLTPSSMYRPWVHFEAGGAYFHPDKYLFVATAFGITPASLPANLQFQSLRDLHEPKQVRQLISDLGEVLGLHQPLSITNGSLEPLNTLAQGRSGGWNLVQPAMVAEKTSGSPFQLIDLIEGAQKQVFVAGQNVYSLTKGKIAHNAKESIFRFLSHEDVGRVVQILLQDPNYKPGREAWTSLLSDFAEDLDQSVVVLRHWLDQAKQKGINQTGNPRLHIKVTSLVPVSFNFFDPDESHGKMFCTPVLRRGPESELRPVFYLDGGKNNKILTYYWDIWKLHFKNGAQELV